MARCRLVAGPWILIILAVTAASAQSQEQSFLWKQCNEDVLDVRLDPAPFRDVVGPGLSLALEEGKARVIIIVQDCSQYWVDGEDLGPTQDTHLWVAITGPRDVEPVVGAEQTMPRMRWFNLFAGSTNPRVRQARAASKTAQEPIDGVTLDSSGDLARGRVSVGEGLSYSWEVRSVVPPPARMMGVNHEVFMRDSSGTMTFKKIQALFRIVGGPLKGPWRWREGPIHRG